MKKIVSIVLAVVMLIGILPVIPAFGADSELPYLRFITNGALTPGNEVKISIYLENAVGLAAYDCTFHWDTTGLEIISGQGDYGTFDVVDNQTAMASGFWITHYREDAFLIGVLNARIIKQETFAELISGTFDDIVFSVGGIDINMTNRIASTEYEYKPDEIPESERPYLFITGPQPMTVGKQARFDVYVENAKGCQTFNLEFSYDPAQIEYISDISVGSGVVTGKVGSDLITAAFFNMNGFSDNSLFVGSYVMTPKVDGLQVADVFSPSVEDIQINDKDMTGYVGETVYQPYAVSDDPNAETLPYLHIVADKELRAGEDVTLSIYLENAYGLQSMNAVILYSTDAYSFVDGSEEYVGVASGLFKEGGYSIAFFKMTGVKDTSILLSKLTLKPKRDGLTLEGSLVPVFYDIQVMDEDSPTGETVFEIVDTHQHVRVAVAGKPATCTEAGLTDGAVCSVCGEILEAQQVIPATGHKAQSLPNREATCTAAGYIGGTQCSVCGKVLTPQTMIPALGHTDVNGDGLCDRCGRSVSDDHPVLTIIPGKAATCTEPGLTVGIKCADCGEILLAQEEIPALGHKIVKFPGRLPTCTASGWTEGERCSVCNEFITEPEEIPATGHNAVVIPARKATCTATGMTEGVRCADCGEILVQAEEIPALGHSTVTVPGRAATCTRDGATAGERCTVCGLMVVAQEAVPAKGHTVVKLAGQAPTCTAPGWTEGEVCSECNRVLTPRQTIKPTGHIPETIPGKAATCTETGLTDGEKCSACGKVLKAQEEIPVLGHKAEAVPGKAATCTEAGLTDGEKCSVCGEILKAQEEIPALGHTAEAVPGKAATCTETGLTDGEKCSVCGEILKAQETIPALGHTAEAVPGKAATCIETGLTDGEKCSVCGEMLKAQEEIPALGHTAEAVSGKAATCTETGLTDGEKCSVCGEVLKAQEEIPATGHADADGDGKCDNCGQAMGLRGDADLDGKVLAKDARLVLRASARLEKLEGQAFVNCDLDGNGKLLASEARMILRFSAKLEKEI